MTKAHKAQFVKDVAATLQPVSGKRPEHIHIMIELVDEDNRGYAGSLTTEFDKGVGSE